MRRSPRCFVRGDPQVLLILDPYVSRQSMASLDPNALLSFRHRCWTPTIQRGYKIREIIERVEGEKLRTKGKAIVSANMYLIEQDVLWQ